MGIQDSASPKAPQDGRKAAYFARNEQALLAATQDVLGEIGWTAKISDVAKTANVATSTIYMHFENKDALFEAAVVSAMTEWEAWVAERLASIKDPLELLVAPMRLFVRVPETHPRFAKMVAKNVDQTSALLPNLTTGVLAHIRELAAAGLINIDHLDERTMNLVAVLKSALERRLIGVAPLALTADMKIALALPMIGIPEAEAMRLMSLPLPASAEAAHG